MSDDVGDGRVGGGNACFSVLSLQLCVDDGRVEGVVSLCEYDPFVCCGADGKQD